MEPLQYYILERRWDCLRGSYRISFLTARCPSLCGAPDRAQFVRVETKSKAHPLLSPRTKRSGDPGSRLPELHQVSKAVLDPGSGAGVTVLGSVPVAVQFEWIPL